MLYIGIDHINYKDIVFMLIPKLCKTDLDFSIKPVAAIFMNDYPYKDISMISDDVLFMKDFKDEKNTLEEAQNNKIDHIIKKLKLENLGYSCKELENQTAKKIDTPEEFSNNFIAVIKSKDDTSYMVKVSGASKKLAEKKGLKKCKETGNTACYVHYSGLKPEY